MSHFYGSMKGSRKEKTCCGHKSTGMTAHIRGWNSGVKIDAYRSKNDLRDMFTIRVTGGSKNPEEVACLEVYQNPNGEFSIYLGEKLRKAFSIKSRPWTKNI